MNRSSDLFEPTADRLMVFAISTICVALLWAVIFYRPVERRRVSLTALFVLLFMEASYFALLKLFRGW
jgi:bacteriorhodopsin